MQNKSNQDGYDQPIKKESEDYFGRGRLASELWEIAGKAPKDWSVRIGLYGKWGEGKTSVLHLLERLANDEGHIIAWFNPWSIRDRDSLWRKFAGAIFPKLEEGGIEIERAVKAKFLGYEDKFSVPIKKVMDAAKAAGGVVGGGLSLLETLFEVNSKTFNQIREHLGNRRFIVIIDDLDRADPSLLPELLLSLREILDIPGFTFVLAFDVEIVAKALADQYAAWETGEEFLEKIIDFPFVLPLPTDGQLKEFLQDEIEKNCDFIDRELLDEILPLLPKNPRKIKLFVRHIWTLKKQVYRHYDWELDWPSLFILQLLKIESANFCRLLSQQSKLCEKITVWQFQKFGVIDDEVAEEEKEFKQNLDEIFENLNLAKQDQRKARIRFLVLALAEKNDAFVKHSLHYQINLVDQSPAITLKESQEVFDVWEKTKNLESVNDWVKGHSKYVSLSVLDVGGELFEKLVKFRLLKLKEAADVWEMDQYLPIMKDANESLEFLNALVSQGLPTVGNAYFQSTENFQRLWDMAREWNQFIGNDMDKSARQRESEVLSDVLEFAENEASAYLKILQPWEGEHGLGAEFNHDLAKSLEKKLIPYVTDDLLKRMGDKRGFSSFMKSAAYIPEKYVLFNIEGPLWVNPCRERVLEIWRTAGENPVVHQNCVSLIKIITKCVVDGGMGIPYSPDLVRKIILDKEIVSTLWKAAIARKVQFRSLKNLKEIGEQLICIVGDEEIISIPDWLSESSTPQ